MKSSYMPLSSNLKDIQIFTPVPANTVQLTVPAGGNVVWTVPDGVNLFMFRATCSVC